jgi:hypothetical protein
MTVLANELIQSVDALMLRATGAKSPEAVEIKHGA